MRWLILGGGWRAWGRGLLAVLFYFCLEGLKHLVLVSLAGFSPCPPRRAKPCFSNVPGPFRPLGSRRWPWEGSAWSRGYVVTAPDSGHPHRGSRDGTDATIRAFHRQAGLIRPRVPLLIKGAHRHPDPGRRRQCRPGRPHLPARGRTGLAFGPKKLGLTARERRILLLAGAAGGTGGHFPRAPLGGAITAVEVLYAEDFEAEALLPAVVSSVVAYALFTFVFGAEAIIQDPWLPLLTTCANCRSNLALAVVGGPGGQALHRHLQVF